MAVNLNPLTKAIKDWIASIDGKVYGSNPTGASIYGSKGWNDGTTLGTGTEYFVATTGSDSNPGTEVSPFLTITYAIAQLGAGDTLTIENGTYNEAITPATPTQSGTVGQPITVRARNYGSVFVYPLTADTEAISFYSSATQKVSGWTVDGIIARSTGEAVTIHINSQDNIPLVDMTNNIVIKRCGAYGSVIDTNRTVVNVARSADCLLEDTFAYGNGRKAYQIFGSYQITVRNAVGRYDYWRGNLDKPNDPRLNMSCYNTQRSLFENIILLDSGDDPPGTNQVSRAGMIMSGNDTDVSTVTGSSDNLAINVLALNNVGNGIENNGGSGNPTTGIVFKDCISWDNTSGGFNIQNNSDGTAIYNCTAGGNGFTGIRYNPNPGDPLTNQILTTSFSINNAFSGIYTNAGQMAVFENCTAVGNAVDGDIDPANAPTLDHIVNPIYVGNNIRGGKMIFKSKDGALTNEPMWPWPYESIIQTHMLDDTDLADALRTAGGMGVPGWKTSGKSLTNYIWEYLGNPAPPGYGV